MPAGGMTTDLIDSSDEVLAAGTGLASAAEPMDAILPIKKPRFPIREASDAHTDFFFKIWLATALG